jgi:penicillin-binding protein 2
MNGKFIKPKKKIEFEEVLLDKITPLDQKLEKPLVGKNVYLLFGIIAFVLFLLLLRSFYLEIIKNQYYLSLSFKNANDVSLILPARGVIYDRNFNQLVNNKFVFDLVYENESSFSDMEEEIDAEIYKVSEILNEDPQAIKEKIINSGTGSILIYQNLSQEQLIELKSKSDEIPHFKIKETLVRNYSSPLALSHLIGYTNKITKEEYEKLKDYDISDIIGREGLEKFYEKTLRGRPGKLLITKDALSREIKRETIQEPEDGKSLVLYLDKELQEKSYEIFENTLNKFNTKKGALVILDPKTGGILSMLSFPSYDNNLFNSPTSTQEVLKIFEDINSPLVNRAISGVYPGGSTIKPFLAIGGLEEKLINPYHTIICPGYLLVKNPWGKSTVFHDWRAHGTVDLKKAISQSCDVYFYRLGEMLGVERIKRYLESFGFEEETKIDLPNEKIGFIPDPNWKKSNLNDDWRIGDTYNLSIGQGYLKITPLQMALATSSIVNDGKIFKPQIVKAVINSNREIIYKFEPEILRELNYNKENFKIVREGMRETAISGTASSLRYLPVEVGAKTGTAQTSRKNVYNYWISIFAPYENPEIVLTVLVEDVKANINPAIEISREILNYYFTR